MDKPKTTEPVRRLSDHEIADLRADMQQAAEWARKELARRRQKITTSLDTSDNLTQSALYTSAKGNFIPPQN